jgi:hypothetical protein
VTRLDLSGLTAGPSQVWGGVRLVPLLRERPVEGLRLDARLYGDEPGLVALDRRTAYCSYIPHGFVATWTTGGQPAAAYGTQLAEEGQRRAVGCVPVRPHRRMARRVARDRLRFLPLHLALEGYLSLHFGGPEVVWEEWSRRAVAQGLSPRAEQAYTGAEVTGLEDALRAFEIHPGQSGVLVYVADALAAAFAVPHPDDYPALHGTLVRDLYGELVHQYGLYGAPVPEFRARLDDTRIGSLAELRAAAGRAQREWAAFHDTVMAPALLETRYDVRRVYRAGPFTLSRFLPPFTRGAENHIGEAITDPKGRVAYLKTFRLSEKQVRRGHLLQRLAAHDWSPPAAAASMGIGREEFLLRMENAGFGALLRQDVLDGARAAARRGTVPG